MILIKNNWEQVVTIDDIVDISKEYIGEEFADLVIQMCKKPIKKMKENLDQLDCAVFEIENMPEPDQGLDLSAVQNCTKAMHDCLDSIEV